MNLRPGRVAGEAVERPEHARNRKRGMNVMVKPGAAQALRIDDAAADTVRSAPPAARVSAPPGAGVHAGDAAAAPGEESDLAPYLELLQDARAAGDMLRKGSPRQAAEAYESLLREHASQPALWYGLAAALSEDGERRRAIECLERACRLRPAFAPYLRHLGEAYRQSGRLEEARRTLEKAVRLQPTSPQAVLELAVTACQCGRGEEGLARLRQAFAVMARRLGRRAWRAAASGLSAAAFTAAAPLTGGWRGFAWRLNHRLALHSLERGDFALAERRLRKRLEAAPADPDALWGLGRALLESGRDLEAQHALETAAAAAPGHAQVLATLGMTYLRRASIDAAHRTLEAALTLDPDAPKADLAMGWTLLRMERPDAAMGHFEKCLRRAPDDADAAFGMSMSLQNLGNFDDGTAWLHRTRHLRPAHASALMMLVKNDKTRRNAETLATAEKLLALETLPARDRVQVHFAAGMSEDHLGRVDRAFEHYEAANSLKDVVCDIDAAAAAAAALAATFTPRFFAERRDWGDDSERPIFIVGMPRSGSTLVEQILASHPDVAGAGELYHLGKHVRALRRRRRMDARDMDYAAGMTREDVRALARDYLRDIAAIDDTAARVTDKMLYNFWHLGLIALAFPRARIIHTTRDPLDCCTSIYLRDFAGIHGYAYNQTNLGQYYRIYESLMAHWRQALATPILDVAYEDMVREPLPQMRALVAHCGLSWDERCSAFYRTRRTVSTSSYAQVRQPIYTDSLAKWKRYERHLGELRQALGR